MPLLTNATFWSHAMFQAEPPLLPLNHPNFQGCLRFSKTLCTFLLLDYCFGCPLARNATSIYLHTLNPQGYLKCFSSRQPSLPPQVPGNGPTPGPPRRPVRALPEFSVHSFAAGPLGPPDLFISLISFKFFERWGQSSLYPPVPSTQWVQSKLFEL